MKKVLKLIAFVLCLCFVANLVACTGDEANDDKVTSQKVYNTLFQTATTVAPNSTTVITTEDESTTEVDVAGTQEEIIESNQFQTIDRDGERPVFEQSHDMRKISSKQLLSQMGSGITLGDSFTSRGLPEEAQITDYETFYNNPVVAKELIDAYKKAGFSAVRIPICWSDHIDEKGVVDAAFLDRIEEIVNYCIDNYLYCIINSQNDQNWLTTNSKDFNKTKQRFKQMWTDISKKFIGYNDWLIFEGIADVLKAENDKSAPTKNDYKNANELNQAFVDAVRKTGGRNAKRHLIISTYGAFIDTASLEAFSVPKDSAKNKLIAKVNIYAPSSFCLDESKDNMWGSDEDKKYIEMALNTINQRFTKLKIPVIVGEFGAVDKGNVSARAAYAKHIVATAYNYYIVCFWNDNGHNMKLFDRNNYKVFATNIVNSLIRSAS